MTITEQAALKLYEKGLPASLVVKRLRQGGHALEDVAHVARRHFRELDAMLFGDAWGTSESDQRDARLVFLHWRESAR